MRNFLRLLFTIVLSIQSFSIYSYAQGTDNYIVNLPSMPYLSPEAASLGKYGEITVSEYTMVSQIFSIGNKQH